MASSTVLFPSTESPLTGPPSLALNNRPPLLPFRKISLPTAPSLLNRQSVASMASFDSLPEQGPLHTFESAVQAGVAKSNSRKAQAKPSLLENNRRGRRRETYYFNEAMEAKRRRVIAEFYETERAYVAGLDLIYSHFLTPLIASLDSPSPLLERAELTTVFSNFIDIWNLHRSFFTQLTTLLSPILSDPQSIPPLLSPVLVSHFPYLSLYTPFITSFPTVLSSLLSLSRSNSAFAAFIKRQEADERCGKLKLRDWLLTVVQRCPRYLLLLKDLIDCTEAEDPEHAALTTVHTLLSKITDTLDTSLHAHSQILSLLSLQRATPNLPFQMIAPGRTLLKRGPLLQIDNSSTPKHREFLLFSDCLLWLASDRMIESDWLHRNEKLLRSTGLTTDVVRPDMKRTRSKSENELPTLISLHKPAKQGGPKKVHFSQPEKEDEKWWYKGKADLVDLEVVISPGRGSRGQTGLELLSPEMSFVVYAETEEERNEWVSTLRGAKASLLVSLNMMHPNTTLTSSSSSNHLRKTLQALPYLPEADENLPKRGRVDHFVPAIWVPDGKTDGCMRCGRLFGWRRRRHHCRLCGRCVCARCSDRTFFIYDSNAKDMNKSARACNACYETVFPVLATSGSENEVVHSNSGSTLSTFPSWELAQALAPEFTPSYLMAIDGPARSPHAKGDNKGDDAGAAPHVRRRRMSRPLSHPSIPQEFHGSRPRVPPPSPGRAHPEEQGDRFGAPDAESPFSTPESSAPPSPGTEPSPRERKRFSLPALAIQTPQVTARPNATGAGREKRYSLVLVGKGKAPAHSKLHVVGDGGPGEGLRNGVAAARLTELLERARVQA